eukprot:c37563_g1_i1 orf=171-350(+)
MFVRVCFSSLQLCGLDMHLSSFAGYRSFFLLVCVRALLLIFLAFALLVFSRSLLFIQII